MERPQSLRKGAWTCQEDNLLRKCIQQHGEGKWHQVPLKAGLNRCRKSCRLRWLNYLKPDIKRGEFTEDEIDLMSRLHKLLGNRWALISGRLPGRTANDVKNYWNTHMQKRKNSEVKEKAEAKIINKNNIIRPRPLKFSKNYNCRVKLLAASGDESVGIAKNYNMPARQNPDPLPFQANDNDHVFQPFMEFSMPPTNENEINLLITTTSTTANPNADETMVGHTLTLPLDNNNVDASAFLDEEMWSYDSFSDLDLLNLLQDEQETFSGVGRKNL